MMVDTYHSLTHSQTTQTDIIRFLISCQDSGAGREKIWIDERKESL